MRRFFVVLLLIFSPLIKSYCLAEKYPYRKVKLGIDVLIEQNFSILTGRRVGLLCNSASRASDERLTAEHFALASNFTLSAIFTPEHGFFADVPAGRYVLDDSIYGVPVFSLYGNNRKPTPFQMSLVDVIVIDLQDIGIRSYTFISTMAKVFESAAENNKEVIVLDRPNPLGGDIVDGNMLDSTQTSFVGIAPIAYLHGCTIGELAKMFIDEGWIKNGEKLKANLLIVKMENWQRTDRWEDTGLRWYPTSPNIPSVNAIRGAAMFGIFGELQIFNLGIGTIYPFQFLALKNKNIIKIKSNLKNLKLQGIDFEIKYFGQLKKPETRTLPLGFLFKFNPSIPAPYFSLGAKIMLEVKKNFPTAFNFDNIHPSRKNMFNKIVGNQEFLNAFCLGLEENVSAIVNQGLDDFLKIRSKYLMY